jgi:hypothetical protein
MLFAEALGAMGFGALGFRRAFIRCWLRGRLGRQVAPAEEAGAGAERRGGGRG